MEPPSSMAELTSSAVDNTCTNSGRGNDHESYDCVSMYHSCGSGPERNRAGTSRASESESASGESASGGALVPQNRIGWFRLRLSFTGAMQ